MKPFVVDETIDQSKFDRQKIVVKKWIDNGRVGTFIAVTGFGKTFTGIIGIRNTIRVMGEIDITVVVPNLYLKEQWEKDLNSHGIEATVITVQSAINQNIKTTMLVLDEIHRYTADEFSRVYDCIDYQYVIGLTATLEQDDPRYPIIEMYCPVIDEVTYDEALRHNWISDWITYCLPVQMETEDIIAYKKLDKRFKWFFDKFIYDFDLMFKCCNEEGAKDWADEIKQPVGKVVGWANQARQAMGDRKSMIMNSTAKLEIAKEIIGVYGERKMIVFTEYTDAADKMAAEFDFAESYHSSMPTKLYKDGKVIGHKTNKKGTYETTKGIMSWKHVRKIHGQVERVSDKRQCKRIMDDFKSGKVKTLVTAKKLDEGADLPELIFSLIHSANSSKRQDVQRRGRTIRVQEGKLAFNIQLFVPNTQDEVWLKKRLKKVPNVRYVENIDDLYENINYNL